METPGASHRSAGKFKMIDVGAKADTRRLAVASGCFFARPETIRMISERRIPKGDVLALAEMAGIQGAKSTPSLLPLCHPLPLHSVRLWSETYADSIRVWCEVSATGKTGVEMEALVGVNVALLCIYDLTKMVDPVLRIGEVYLERKEGGKSGVWTNPATRSSEVEPTSKSMLRGKRVCLLTISDRCARGEAENLSGKFLRSWFEERGAEVVGESLVPDEIPEISRQMEAWLEQVRPDAVFSTGGTGLSPRDITPEALLRLSELWGGREVPGIGELLRASGARHTEMAWASRSLGLYLRDALVVALPGSARAVEEGLRATESLLEHLLHIGRGGDHIGRHKVR